VKVRLHGVDTPEKAQAFGTRAPQFTSDLVFQRDVMVVVQTTDRYGRLVGEVLLPDGRSLNQELVRAGMAWWYRLVTSVIPVISGLGGGLLGWLSSGLIDGFIVGEIKTQSFPNEGIRRSLRNAAISGLGGGLVLGLIFGGKACLHHFALHLVLWHNDFAPLNYVRFLDYATSRVFLRKVGGGYVFVHRMLLEYFAALHQTSAEQQNCNTNG
jgi:Staphylococcal nuclease homologue